MPVEQWEWDYLEHRRQRDGETNDYFFRKKELEQRENHIQSKNILKKLIKDSFEKAKNRQAVQITDDFAYDDWNNNQSWSDYSRLIRG